MTYQQMLNSGRWRGLRAAFMAAHPLCEMCKREGRISAAECVHHITPVETARTESEMERLCFSESNLQALCQVCHHRIHHEEKYHTRAAHRQREAERLERWKERRRG